MGRHRIFFFITLGVLALGVVAPSAFAGSGPPVLPGAEYRGKGAEVRITATGDSVEISKLPVKQECKGSTPTNLGDFGDPGLGPFPIKSNGTFTNGGGEFSLEGRFKGKAVTGTVKAAAFKDPSKGFDCAGYSGTFSARLVKGTGLEPGKVLARDDFSDPNSGFAVFNTTNTFSEYLPDHRFRIGLRGQAAITSLREEPAGLSTVEIEADSLTYGGEPGDEIGLVCQAINDQSFTTGVVSQGGVAQLIRFEGGSIVERSPDVQLPAGLLRTGEGAQNTLKLVCRAIKGGGTQLELWVNGTKVVSATPAASNEGSTGVFVAGSGNGTDYNFTSYEVRVPKKA